MKKFVVFASGNGSNCKKIYEWVVKSKKTASLEKIISDNPNAGILKWADSNQIKKEIITPKLFGSEEEFGKTLIGSVGQNIDLVVLAGYLKKIPDVFLTHYKNQIVNIHPALLPSFGGIGMYGINVHKEVFKSGVKISGITIHLIDEQYDHGPIIFQVPVPVENCNSAEDIASEILKVEHKHYGEIIEKLLTVPFYVQDGKFYWKDNE